MNCCNNYKKVNLLGPYNSGTNLIANIFSKTIPNMLIKSTVIWKHTLNYKDLCNCIEMNPDTLFIIMYRPLFTWIPNMKKIVLST